MIRGRRLLAAVLSVLLVAGCASSKAGASKPASTHTYTLGLLTDMTGLAASAESTTPNGVKAAVGLANSEGNHLSYVLADAQSSPSGALAAAQRLVEQDHVFAVIAISGLTFAAAQYLTSHGVPVLGAATDGPEWITSRNMFSVFGYTDFAKVTTTAGLIFKHLGVTKVASLGYGIVPSASESAKAAAASAQSQGIGVGYLNANFPFGSTNVGPVVLAMKSANVDGFTGSVEENTAFALGEGLRQAGVTLKAALFAVGYGRDLFAAGPGAELAAQNGYFQLSYEPVEMQTAATQRL